MKELQAQPDDGNLSDRTQREIMQRTDREATMGVLDTPGIGAEGLPTASTYCQICSNKYSTYRSYTFDPRDGTPKFRQTRLGYQSFGQYGP
jgi:hypothetical protein